MKYILASALIGLALAGCTDKKSAVDQASTDSSTSSANSSVSATADQTAAAIDQANQTDQEIHFTGPNDLTIILKTTDHFETAELRDNSDKTYQLKRVVSGSGIRLANEEGVSIHFKNFDGVNEGTVELVKDKPIEIKEHR